MSAIIPIPAFSDNYIWLLKSGRDAIAFDVGDAAPLQHFLAERGLRLVALFCTHHHHDHIGGNEAIARQWNCPIYAPKIEPIPAATHPLLGGEKCFFPAMKLKVSVISVPGHTRGHLAYFCDKEETPPALFCGDALFSCGCGRLFEGTAEEMYESLNKLAALPDETRICCGHEYTAQNVRFAQWLMPDSDIHKKRAAEVEALRRQNRPTLPVILKDERATNPFLRADDPALQTRVRALGFPDAIAPVQIFAALRLLKDRF